MTFKVDNYPCSTCGRVIGKKDEAGNVFCSKCGGLLKVGKTKYASRGVGNVPYERCEECGSNFGVRGSSGRCFCKKCGVDFYGSEDVYEMS